MTGFGIYLLSFFTIALIFGIATMGLNLQWGFTGLFNAGVVGFFAIGAYTYAILVGPDHPLRFGGFGLPFVVGLLGALILSGLAAILVGLATVRLRTHYLAIATFGIALTIQLIAVNMESVTGGANGLSFPRPLYETVGRRPEFEIFYLGLVIVIALAVYLVLQQVLQSPWGRVLKAIREDETAAISLGKDVRWYRLQAFVVGCMVMGLAGGLYVGFIGFVSAFDFLPIVTFQIWTMLIIGGSGNNRGAILGAVVVWAIWTFSGWAISSFMPPEWQVRASATQVILIGLMLVLSLLFRPRGLIGEQTAVSRGARID